MIHHSRPMVRCAIATFAMVSTLLLTGCSAGGASADATPTASAAPVDHTVQATIDGEWIVTRIVATSDDVTNPDHAVGATTKRRVMFGDIACTDGPCTGGVVSGATTAVRASTTFASSANTITYTFTGFLNCVDPTTGTVLLANGYAYTSHVVLTVKALDKGDSTKATTLEGTIDYTDKLTDAAIEAGCTRDPIATTISYTVTAVRASAADTASDAATPGGTVDTTTVSGGGFGNDAGDN